MNKKRKCSRCRKSEPKVEFGSDYGKNGGASFYCITCRRESRKKYYLKNKEASLEKSRKYRERHPEKIKKFNSRYYRENKQWWTNWRENNKERWGRIQISYRQRLKEQAISAYGGKCSCCGEDKLEFLTLEHVNHDGKKHRDMVWSVYRDLRRRGWPKNGITVFCWNCQMATRFGDKCPHKARTNERRNHA